MLLWITVILTLFLNTFEFSAIFNVNNDDDLTMLKRAKRNLLCREKEYLKSQPMSKQLKSFINRYKKKVKNPKPRIKHAIEDNMYVLNNGNVVPLNDIQIRNVLEEYTTSPPAISDRWKFTVLPVIVPKTEDPCETVPTLPKIEPPTTSISLTTTSISIPTTIIVETTFSDTSTISKTHKTTTIEEQEEESNIEKDDYENVPIEFTTKGKLLHKVIQDVEELIKYENEAKTEGELSLCNVTGDWDSYAGGVQIRITSRISSTAPRVEIVPREPPMDGFFNGSIWNATAFAPFPHQSLVAITAVSTKPKKLAIFLGECRICEGAESIAGHWMVRRKSKNCKDREEANSIISDVLRKNNVRKLQQKHLAEIERSTLQNIETTSEDM